IAGLCAAGTWLLVFGIVLAVSITSGNGGGSNRNAAGEIIEAGPVDFGDLRPGDCVNGLELGVRFRPVAAVPCREPHEAEVFAAFDLPPGPFPGDSVVTQRAENGCLDRLGSYAPNAIDHERLEVFYLAPDQRSWGRDRRVVCLAANPPATVGSIRG
ncbi:MAG: septum formation family protein, partial [Sporichthyaceae bacterium]|nr:septum formation family protein [Sporichthyaceae bacterium]